MITVHRGSAKAQQIEVRDFASSIIFSRLSATRLTIFYTPGLIPSREKIRQTGRHQKRLPEFYRL